MSRNLELEIFLSLSLFLKISKPNPKDPTYLSQSIRFSLFHSVQLCVSVCPTPSLSLSQSLPLYIYVPVWHTRARMVKIMESPCTNASSLCLFLLFTSLIHTPITFFHTHYIRSHYKVLKRRERSARFRREWMGRINSDRDDVLETFNWCLETFLFHKIAIYNTDFDVISIKFRNDARGVDVSEAEWKGHINSDRLTHKKEICSRFSSTSLYNCWKNQDTIHDYDIVM